MNVGYRVAARLVWLCGGLMILSACATMGARRTAGVADAGAERSASASETLREQNAEPAVARATPFAITCDPVTTKVNCNDAALVRTSDPSAILRPLNSSSLSRDELKVLGPDVSAWIAFARGVAGATDGAERIYVDGMPAPATMTPAMIGRITVNGDPFSAEYSNVGEMRIDIALRPAERRWHAGLSTPAFGAGGGSPLGPTGTPVARHSSIGVSGPVPRLPLTFSIDAAQSHNASRPLFVSQASGALTRSGGDLETSATNATLVMSLALSTSRVSARASFSDSRLQADHAGIGGTSGPTTGQRLDSVNRRWQASWRVAGGGLVHRGGVTVSQDRLSAAADSSAPLVMVADQFATGGDELATNARRSDAWIVKHVIEAGAGKWIAGVEGRSELVSDDRTLNTHGRLQLSAVDATTGTWFVSRGASAAAVRATSLAVFAEQFTINSPRATLRSGVRVDWQDGGGALLSPRVVAAVRLAGLQLSGGAGLFAQSWAPDLFVLAAERDGTRGQTFVIHDVPRGSIDDAIPVGGETLRAILNPDFTRRRDLIVRAGLQRRVGPLQAGIEHTWTRGEGLPGGARARDARGLVDEIASDRSLRRHQTYVRSSMGRGAGSISAYYQHVWSFDDSDGPFGSPARAGDLSGEWARSAGVARHGAGVTGLTRLPGDIRVSLSFERRSSTPYTVVTGADAEGLAVFTDRGGRPRNSGTLPAFSQTSVSLSRTVRVPRASWLALDVGVRADNLTNRLNVTRVGPVVGTSMFGQPIDAAPGRSIRFWATFAR